MIWLNGRLQRREDSAIDIADRGFLLGDGLFETIRAYHGKPFKLGDHLLRLSEGASELRIPLPFDIPMIADAVLELVEANALNKSDAAIRITLTRGPGQRGLVLPDDPRPTLLISAAKYESPDRQAGLSAITANAVRRNEGSLLSRLKSLNYLDNVLAMNEAVSAGADEAVMLNNRGAVACGSRSNIFVLRQGVLTTPPVSDGVLPGITRQAVLSLAAQLRLEAAEATLSPNELVTADEAFLTNSLMGVVPLRRMDGRELPGKNCRERLMPAWTELAR